MNQKELKELVEFLIEKDISEFELERGDVKVKIKRAQASSGNPIVHQIIAPSTPGAVHSAPATASVAAVAPTAPPVAEEAFHLVKSPIVGTYYDAPAPGAPPFVQLGDVVGTGDVLCIIEAMKLMNEIESDVAGEVMQKLVTNGQAVEYGQPLFAIRMRT
jgi:acetyl-CoA carboxylase biotin carboxyl carrier protein